MAPRDAIASGLGLRKADRQGPLAERSLLADVIRLISGMNLMTGSTGPSFGAVHVQVVKVLVSVSEIR